MQGFYHHKTIKTGRNMNKHTPGRLRIHDHSTLAVKDRAHLKLRKCHKRCSLHLPLDCCKRTEVLTHIIGLPHPTGAREPETLPVEFPSSQPIWIWSIQNCYLINLLLHFTFFQQVVSIQTTCPVYSRRLPTFYCPNSMKLRFNFYVHSCFCEYGLVGIWRKSHLRLISLSKGYLEWH